MVFQIEVNPRKSQLNRSSKTKSSLIHTNQHTYAHTHTHRRTRMCARAHTDTQYDDDDDDDGVKAKQNISLNSIDRLINVYSLK